MYSDPCEGRAVLRTQAATMLTLLTGPVRSGKSTYALALARAAGREPVYVATAAIDPADAEMTDRIARHRAERGTMRTIETDERVGPRLVETLADAATGDVLIVDSLGSWLGSFLRDVGVDGEQTLAIAGQLAARANELLAAIVSMKSDAVIVAEETGWGVVPPYPVGRVFRDELGRLTAALAGRADRAYLIVAGFAVDLHAIGRRVNA